MCGFGVSCYCVIFVDIKKKCVRVNVVDFSHVKANVNNGEFWIKVKGRF